MVTTAWCYLTCLFKPKDAMHFQYVWGVTSLPTKCLQCALQSEIKHFLSLPLLIGFHQQNALSSWAVTTIAEIDRNFSISVMFIAAIAPVATFIIEDCVSIIPTVTETCFLMKVMIVATGAVMYGNWG